MNGICDIMLLHMYVAYVSLFSDDNGWNGIRNLYYSLLKLFMSLYVLFCPDYQSSINLFVYLV